MTNKSSLYFEAFVQLLIGEGTCRIPENYRIKLYSSSPSLRSSSTPFNKLVSTVICTPAS